MQNDDEWLTPMEAAKFLNIGLTTFRGLLISYSEIGKSKQYSKEVLREYRRRNTKIVEEKTWNHSKGKTRRIGGTTSRLTVYDFEKAQKRQIRN